MQSSILRERNLTLFLISLCECLRDNFMKYEPTLLYESEKEYFVCVPQLSVATTLMDHCDTCMKNVCRYSDSISLL